MNSKSLHFSLRVFELLTDRCFPHYYKTSHVCRFVPDKAKIGNIEGQIVYHFMLWRDYHQLLKRNFLVLCILVIGCIFI